MEPLLIEPRFLRAVCLSSRCVFRRKWNIDFRGSTRRRGGVRWSRIFGQPVKVYSRASGRHWDDDETPAAVHGGVQEAGGARSVAGRPQGVRRRCTRSPGPADGLWSVFMLSRAALPLCFRSSGQDRRQAAVEGAGLLHMCGPLAFGAGLGDGGSRRCSCLSAATCSRRRVISPAMAMRSRAMPMPVQRAPAADGWSGFGRGAGTGTGNGSGRGPVGFGLGSGMTPPRRRRSCFAMQGGVRSGCAAATGVRGMEAPIISAPAAASAGAGLRIPVGRQRAALRRAPCWRGRTRSARLLLPRRVRARARG